MEMFNRQRCYHHPDRETVARCPSCERFFCRECVTEHDDRMLCVSCLAGLSGRRQRGSTRWIASALTAIQGLGGLLMLWYAFYLVGKMLLAIPHEFHEGTIWQTDWWSNP